MDDYEALSHTTWDCKYHVVFIPKCRRKTLYLELRRHLGEVFHRLAAQEQGRKISGPLALIRSLIPGLPAIPSSADSIRADLGERLRRELRGSRFRAEMA